MNDNLLNIVTKIVAEQGENVFAEPRRVVAFFADLAHDEPKPQKNAFIKCLEDGFPQLLKNTSEPERALCKQRLAQKLHDDEGFDLELCEDTVELLATVLFGKEQKKIYCKNCGKELEEGWKSCPYCTTLVATDSISSVIKNGKEENNETELYNVTLLSAGQPGKKAADDKEKISVIREIRAITGLGIFEGKNMVEGAPQFIKRGVSKDEAVRIKSLINAAGGTVEISLAISSGSGSWGYGVENIKPIAVKSKKKWKTLLLLSIFLGLFGVDRFYAGRKWTGILKIISTCTVYGGFIWWVIDMIIIIRGKFKDAEGNIIAK